MANTFLNSTEPEPPRKQTYLEKALLFSKEFPEGKIFETKAEQDQALKTGLWTDKDHLVKDLPDAPPPAEEPEKKKPGRPPKEK